MNTTFVSSGTTPTPGHVDLRTGVLSTGLPQLSLTGNLIGLGINAYAVHWAWGKGGWFRALVVLGILNSAYFIGKIQKQV